MMHFEVVINQINTNKDNVTLKINNEFADIENKKEILHDADESIKVKNFLSSRLEFMDEEYEENDYKKSLILLSRHNPIYHHYLHREVNARHLRLSNKYRKLPEIKGQTLFGEERHNCENSEMYPSKLANDRIDTLQQLQNSILRYGSNDENVWMGFTEKKHQNKLVRPGFSARRYLSNLSRNLNETLVKKLMCDGYLLEKNLYTCNSVMPHIRRRLSDDLSRYPEPYRILKQMLIAPGPLNEYSFVWGRKNIRLDENSIDGNHEMEAGDIKILSKKGADNGKDRFEEVKYSELSGQKKKIILSNLLVKSAMNHALKMKEEMMDYNDHLFLNNTKEKIPNIHIPVIKFDMKEAITDLLTKETIQTLTTTQMEIPFVQEAIRDRFKGRGLKGFRPKAHNEDNNEEVNQIEIPFFHEPVNDKFKGRGLKEPRPRVQNVFDLEDNNADVIKSSVLGADLPIVPLESFKEPEGFLPQNLTLKLNQTHLTKTNKLKRKVLKSESISGKESVSSDSNVSHVVLNPLDNLVKAGHNQVDRETQGNAFAEMIKRKAQQAATHKENIQPYGKYREPGLMSIGDIDPTSSFSNWKYKDEHVISNVAEPDNITGSGTTDNRQRDHTHLLNLLRGQADSVAESVLERKEGGLDFASDVNIAIKNILSQAQRSGEQIWNLDVENLDNASDYQGIIKNIFKSIFKDDLHTLGGEDLEVSQDLMKLLQSGFNLKLEDIEMITDPSTGKLIAVLKEGIHIPDGIKSSMTADFNARMATPITQGIKDKPLGKLAYLSEINESESSFEYSSVASADHRKKPSKNQVLSADPTKEVAQNTYLHKLIEEKGLVEKEGLLYDKEGGHYDEKGVYYNKSGVVVDSEKINIGDIQNSFQMLQKFQKNSPFQQIIHDKNLIEKQGMFYDNEGGYYDHEGKYYNKSGDFDDSKSLKINGVVGSSHVNNTHDGVIVKEASNQKEGALVGNSIIQNGGFAILNEKEATFPMENDHLKTSEIVNGEEIYNVNDRAQIEQNVRFNENVAVTSVQGNENVASKRSKSKTPRSSKLSLKTDKTMEKGRRTSIKEKGHQKKKDFIFGRPDETKELANIYNNAEGSNASIKVKKSSEKRKTSKKSIEKEKEAGNSREDSSDINIKDYSDENSVVFGKEKHMTIENDDDLHYEDDTMSDDGMHLTEGDDAKRIRELKRQERIAQKKAEVQRLRKESDLRKKMEEERYRLEEQRKALEETVKSKLDEERKRKEEEFRLKKEKEKEEEQAALDVEKRKEYFRMRQIEKERQQKEEFARRKEELRIKQEIEERIRKEEQEQRDREEAAMLAKLNEEERIEYLRQKAELLERIRLEEEEERKRKEEDARLALEEAKRIAKLQAIEKALAEERLKMKIEDEGLKKYLNVSPAFVWSYFEFLNMLGVNDDPSTIMS